MRVGFISDLHIDRNMEILPIQYLKTFVHMSKKQKLEMLIIGGDISNHYSTTIHFVEELQKRAEIFVYFIPGNHDFWEEPDAAKEDRKSTRLNSSHVAISYAVFCL